METWKKKYTGFIQSSVEIITDVGVLDSLHGHGMGCIK